MKSPREIAAERIASVPSRADRKKQSLKERVAQLEEAYGVLLADHLKLIEQLRDVSQPGGRNGLRSYYDGALDAARKKVAPEIA